MEGINQSVQDIGGIFTDGRTETAQPTKDLRSVHRTERAGDFLLHFDHAQIPFGKVVVERRARIGGKAENIGFVLAEAFKK